MAEIESARNIVSVQQGDLGLETPSLAKKQDVLSFHQMDRSKAGQARGTQVRHSPTMNLRSYSLDELLLKRRGLRRQLSAREGLTEIRVAVLSGTTTNEVVDLLEILLLDSGFRPTFY
jgi:hypothetical protein